MSERVIAVVGSGLVGSEIARLAAGAGATVLCLDKGPRPYGELESQVPGWLAATFGGLIGRVDENLAHAEIVFVPRTEVGRDVTRGELESLGLEVVEATGRSLVTPPERLEAPEVIPHQGLIAWFNRRGHVAYAGPDLDVPRQVAVIGDDLRAVDAARLLSLELHQRALSASGHMFGPESLWYQGIGPTVRKLGVNDLPSVTLIVPGGRDALLADAPAELRGQTLEALEQRDLVRVLPGFGIAALVRTGGRLSGLSLSNPRDAGFAMSLPCELLVDARGHLAHAVLEVHSRLPAAVAHKLWEARLIPARSDEAGIARGSALSDALGEAIADLVRPTVAAALSARPAGTRERALAWARSRHASLGFTDYADWIGETRRSWLY